MSAPKEEVASKTEIDAPSRQVTQATVEIEIEKDAEKLEDGSNQQNDEENTGSVLPRSWGPPRLSSSEWWNLVFLLLSFAWTICSTTMIVGASAVVVISVGGGTDISPFALGCFFLGAAFVSLITSPLFDNYGRKPVFFFGNILGLFGAGLGAIAIAIGSPALVITSSLPLGSQFGIGNYLRFAAVEVAPSHAKAFAVTLVLSGGVIAAFVGPELSQATKDMFGDDLEFLGFYMMVAIFNVANIICVSVVAFPTPPTLNDISNTEPDEAATYTTSLMKSLLQKREFITPVLTATLAWAIMAMPMSIVRVAMFEVGFSSRQSLLIVELHFLGMYLPGFVTGKIINKKGTAFSCFMAVLCFIIATIFSLNSREEGERTIATWFLGLIFVGVGWNFGFSGSTVKSTKVYALAPHLKTRLQAANEFFMFLLAGGFIFSTGYIYEGGGSEIDGWRTVNFVVLGLIVFMWLVLVLDRIKKRQEQVHA